MHAAGPCPDLVIADAGYGADTALRARLTALGLSYRVGVTGQVSLWPPGQAPLPPKAWSGRGPRPQRLRRDAEHKPASAKQLALQLPARGLRPLRWRIERDSLSFGDRRQRRRHGNHRWLAAGRAGWFNYLCECDIISHAFDIIVETRHGSYRHQP